MTSCDLHKRARCCKSLSEYIAKFHDVALSIIFISEQLTEPGCGLPSSQSSSCSATRILAICF